MDPGEDSKVAPTEVEKTGGVSPAWRTRSPGGMTCSASLVSEKGIVDSFGMYYDTGWGLLRAAIWISVEEQKMPLLAQSYFGGTLR